VRTSEEVGVSRCHSLLGELVPGSGQILKFYQLVSESLFFFLMKKNWISLKTGLFSRCRITQKSGLKRGLENKTEERKRSKIGKVNSFLHEFFHCFVFNEINKVIWNLEKS